MVQLTGLAGCDSMGRRLEMVQLTGVARCDSVDDVLEGVASDGHEGSGPCCQASLSIRQVGQQLFACIVEFAASSLFDGIGHTACQAELTIGRVDYSCHLLLGQVTFGNLQVRL